ncbi:hypothetical protein GCM10027056_11660 [Glaciibacter psychrotolerans]
MRDTLWAEDGRNFLQDALTHGPLESLVIPYAGYLHTLPRIAASLTVSFVPVAFYAEAMTAFACLAAGVMAGLVFVCSAAVVRWLPARLAISALTVLMPLEAREVLGNMANLHSIVLWSLFWMLLYRPRTRLTSIGLGVFALLGTLTEVQAVFLLPLLLWHPRDRIRWWLRGGYLLGVGIQLAVTLGWPRGHTGNPAVGLSSVVFGYFINSVVPVWIPENAVGPAVVWGGMALCLALFLPFLVAAVVIGRFGSRMQRIAASGLVAGSVLIYSVSIALNPNSFYDYATLSRQDLASLWLVRYGVVPSMMLCALLPIAVDAMIARARRRRRRLHSIDQHRPGEWGAARFPASVRFGIATLTVLALVLAVQFVPQSTRRSAGPQWKPQVAASVVSCRALPDSTMIRLNETLGWHVSVSCGQIE